MSELSIQTVCWISTGRIREESRKTRLGSLTRKLHVPLRDRLMARYSILAFCSYCGRTHPARLTITLKDGPTKKATVADAYKHKTLPLNLAKLLKNAILCPESADSVMLDDTIRFT